MKGFLLDGRRRGSAASTAATAAALAAALCVAALLGGCQPGEPLRIGFVGGISGRWSDMGIGARNGAQLAVEDLNAGGGVAGRRVELLEHDIERQPARAAQAVRDFAARGVAFIVGPMTSVGAETMAPVLDELEMVAITPAAITGALGGRDDHLFRIVSPIEVGARQQADELWRRGVQRVATLADERNRSFAQAWVDAFAARFEARGGRVVTRLTFDSSAGPSYRRVARNLLQSRPDAVLLAASAVDTALVSQQLRSVDGPVLIASSPWGGTEQLIELGGAAVEGTLVGQYFDRDSRAPRYERFAQAYRERFGEAPGFVAVNAYDAVSLGVAALRARTGGQPLAEALRHLHDIDGLQQTLHPDAHGDCDTPLFMTSVIGNRFGSERP